MSIRVKLGSTPTDRQRMFINCDTRRQLFGGAKRGGKSVALCQKAILLSTLFPGNRGGMFRQDLTDLRDSLLVTFFQICPKELILDHHQTHKQILIKTGDTSPPSVILYGGLGDAHDIESAKGKEFGWFAVDEPSEVDAGAVRMLEAQLCWKLPDGSFPPYMVLMASNPEPGWVEEEFRQLIESTDNDRPVATDGRKTFIRALPRDNPYLPPGWEVGMRIDAPVAWQKKYLDGSWEVSEGQVFKEFDRAIHVIKCPPPLYLATLKLVASIDHASTGVTCMCVNGIDGMGNVVALGEYYERNKLVSEHASGMFALLDKWVALTGKAQLVQKLAAEYKGPYIYPAFHALEYCLIDPSTAAKTQQRQNELASIQDEYRRVGVPTMAAHNALEMGVNLLAEYIHVKPTHLSPFTGTHGAPTWYAIGDENPNGIREIIQWRKTINENNTIKYVGPDHWIDNQRYIVMSRPEPPRITEHDIAAMDSATRLAVRDMAKFDRKFRTPGADSEQWFPGGSGTSNQWFSGGA